MSRQYKMSRPLHQHRNDRDSAYFSDEDGEYGTPSTTTTTTTTTNSTFSNDTGHDDYDGYKHNLYQFLCRGQPTRFDDLEDEQEGDYYTEEEEEEQEEEDYRTHNSLVRHSDAPPQKQQTAPRGKPEDFGILIVCGVLTYFLVKNYGRMLWERVVWPQIKSW